MENSGSCTYVDSIGHRTVIFVPTPGVEETSNLPFISSTSFIIRRKPKPKPRSPWVPCSEFTSPEIISFNFSSEIDLKIYSLILWLWRLYREDLKIGGPGPDGILPKIQVPLKCRYKSTLLLVLA